MKSVFAQILALTLLSGAFLVGCAEKESSDTSDTVQVQIPWYSKEAGYGLQYVTLRGLDNLTQVSGKYVKFFLSPRISANKLRGLEPNGQFIKTENGFVPTNSLSIHMATIYAHLQNLAALDKEVGAGDVNQWPRSVGLNVRLQTSRTGSKVNNAFYEGASDSMLIVPYTSQNLPIAVNAGILAHEHFHSLFYKLVIKGLEKTEAGPLVQKVMGTHSKEMREYLEPTDELVAAEVKRAINEREIYHLTLNRALNEGLADFWAWVYTGDPDFIALSLPEAEGARSLRYVSGKLPAASAIQVHLATIGYSDEESLLKYAYTVGSRISRVFKDYTETYARAQNKDSVLARKDVARMIIKALPEMQTDLLAMAKSKNVEESYSAIQFFQTVMKQNPNPSDEEKAFIQDKITDPVFHEGGGGSNKPSALPKWKPRSTK